MSSDIDIWKLMRESTKKCTRVVNCPQCKNETLLIAMRMQRGCVNISASCFQAECIGSAFEMQFKKGVSE